MGVRALLWANTLPCRLGLEAWRGESLATLPAMGPGPEMRHLIDLFDINRTEIEALYVQAAELKAESAAGTRRLPLAGAVLGLVFEKPSLRTRVSFQSAMAQLGGSSIFLNGAEAGLGTRETIPDYARTISGYVDALVVRTFAQATVETFARHATCPVINGLSNEAHPCQALADLFTLREQRGSLAGATLAFIGDGNNMARSLAVACAHLDVRFVWSGPPQYALCPEFLARLRARFPAARLEVGLTPAEAVSQADALYTDVWTSMGQEAEANQRRLTFAPYQVNAALVARAPAHAIILHCLPAHRGEEITDEVLESPSSRVFQQAANRLHVQKALLLWLLAQRAV